MMHYSKIFFLSTVLAALILTSSFSTAEDSTPTLPSSEAAWNAASKIATKGPADVTLADQGVLHIPSNMAFIPQEESNDLLVAWGNSRDDRLIGMVVPTADNEAWAATIDKTLEGYVKDDEARSWDADALLQSLKDGTEASNQDRIDRGFQALEVVGWIEKPNYQEAQHRLVWSMKMIHKGVENDDNAVVNYNTYALGRDGYLEVDLLTNEKTVAHDKLAANQVLAGIQYNIGKRYEDFKPETDHLAEYGIAALIGGLAAKKLGLLALASVFILKFIKIFAVAALVGVGAVKRFFFGNKKTPET